MSPEVEKRIEYAIDLTKDETTILWALLNAPANGVPFASSHIAAALYAKVRQAAVSWDLVKA